MIAFIIGMYFFIGLMYSLVMYTVHESRGVSAICFFFWPAVMIFILVYSFFAMLFDL